MSVFIPPGSKPEEIGERFGVIVGEIQELFPNASRTSAARYLHLDPGHLAKYIAGTRELPLRALINVARMGYSVTWLLVGGPPEYRRQYQQDRDTARGQEQAKHEALQRDWDEVRIEITRLFDMVQVLQLKRGRSENAPGKVYLQIPIEGDALENMLNSLPAADAARLLHISQPDKGAPQAEEGTSAPPGPLPPPDALRDLDKGKEP